MIVGDLASHFGCTVGLKDSVTAVVFVALGTSVPGECMFPTIYNFSIYRSNTFSILGILVFASPFINDLFYL